MRVSIRAGLPGLAVLLGVFGCAQAQDLGGESAANTQGGLDRNTLPPGVTLEACPLALPVHGAACALRTGLCGYRTDDGALERWCACRVDGQWSCFASRSPRSTAPIDSLPVDHLACAEGAPCSGSVECNVGTERWCRCTSSGRLICQGVAAR